MNITNKYPALFAAGANSAQDRPHVAYTCASVLWPMGRSGRRDGSYVSIFRMMSVSGANTGQKRPVCGREAQNMSPVRLWRTGDRANCTNAFWF